MIELPDLTLACVETRHHGLALDALCACLEKCRFARAALLTDLAECPDQALAQCDSAGVEVVDVGVVRSIEAYSRFMLERLVDQVHTSHVLVVQWDGFVVDPSAWDQTFLDFDYIGAVWPFAAATRSVGNGGFSLRSRRLLQAVRERLPAAIDAPEDLVICWHLRDALLALGLRFADPATARRFSHELEAPSAPTFGFHGLPNMGGLMPPQRLGPWLQRLPLALLSQVEAAELGHRCLARGDRASAQLIASRRLEAGLQDGDTRELMMACWSRTEPCWCNSGRSFRRCHGELAAN